MRNRILYKSIVFFIAILLHSGISRAQSPVINNLPDAAVKADSSISYKATISVAKPELKSKVHPNPFTQSFVINTFLPSAQPLKVQLLDMHGSLVRYKSINGLSGENRIEFNDLGNLQAGVWRMLIMFCL